VCRDAPGHATLVTMGPYKVRPLLPRVPQRHTKALDALPLQPQWTLVQGRLLKAQKTNRLARLRSTAYAAPNSLYAPIVTLYCLPQLRMQHPDHLPAQKERDASLFCRSHFFTLPLARVVVSYSSLELLAKPIRRVTGLATTSHLLTNRLVLAETSPDGR
jgi:hypothetical protein